MPPDVRVSNGAGLAPSVCVIASAPAGPPMPKRRDSAETSVSVTFERRTYIASRLVTGAAMSSGSSARNPSGFARCRHSGKFASIRPFGELKLACRHTPSGKSLTSADSWPCRNAAASGPSMASTRSGVRSQTTAPSRAAMSASMAEPAAGAGEPAIGGLVCSQQGRVAAPTLATLQISVLKSHVSSCPVSRLPDFPGSAFRANSQTRAPQGARTGSGRQQPPCSSHWRVVVQP